MRIQGWPIKVWLEYRWHYFNKFFVCFWFGCPIIKDLSCPRCNLFGPWRYGKPIYSKDLLLEWLYKFKELGYKLFYE